MHLKQIITTTKVLLDNFIFVKCDFMTLKITKNTEGVHNVPPQYFQV
jgi:hypothetical protein